MTRQVWKRTSIVLLCIAMLMSFIPQMAFAEIGGESTPQLAKIEGTYLVYEWDESTQTLTSKYEDIPKEAIEITDEYFNSGEKKTLQSGTYCVTGENVVTNGRITISGTVHLILMDGCHLDARNGGIGVNETNSLSIYAQSNREGMGKLTASDDANAGIGGGTNGIGGTITIHGGEIEATGEDIGAGIGGAGGTITIYGGAVEATGGSGAGIGGGDSGEGGTITIRGGIVMAKSRGSGAGIGGGGNGGVGGKITISGGTVTASGEGSGIGGGGSQKGDGGAGGAITISGGTVTAESASAGIGGGYSKNGNGGAGGTIIITGGTVKAGGGNFSAGIGGASGSNAGGEGGKITISGGTVTAIGGTDGGEGIGGGSSLNGEEGNAGTFSTTENGNAFINASSIQDNDDKSKWHGVIFGGEDDTTSGKVYGNEVELTTDAEIPDDKKPVIESGQKLKIGNGTTLTINGTISGTGTLDLSGGGKIKGTVPDSLTLQCKVDFSLVNISAPNAETDANNQTEYTATLEVTDNYQLPESITVTVGGSPLTAEADTYSYNATTGKIIIKQTAITGNISIEAEGVARTYIIEANNNTLNFGSVKVGYTTVPEAQEVTIANTGNQEVTVALPTSTKYTIVAGEGFTDDNATLNPDDTATFTVQPNTGLGAGSHNETITVQGTNGENLTNEVRINANFAVISGGGGGGGALTYYDITALPANYGTIELSRDTIYKWGSVDVTLIPEEGYEVKALLINGENVGAVSEYTIKDITKDMEVSAVFAETEAHKNAYLKEGVENSTIKVWSERTKNGIRVYFKKSYGFKVDGYEFFRSTKKGTFSKKPYYVSKKGTARYLNNTKNIKKGTRYYYKIRGYRTIGGEKIYTKWSNVANRTAR